MKTLLSSLVRSPVLWLAATFLVAGDASAQTWSVAKGSRVSFYAKITASSFTAESTKVTGTVQLDETGSRIVSGSIVVLGNSLKTGMDLRDEHMQEKYLDTEKYPEIKLVIKDAPFPGKVGSKGTLPAKLSVKGVTRDVKIALAISDGGDGKLRAKGKFELDITDYGIEQPKFLVVKMEKVIKISIDALFESNRGTRE